MTVNGSFCFFLCVLLGSIVYQFSVSTCNFFSQSLFLCAVFLGARQRNAPILFSDQDSPGVYGKVRKAASTIDRFR